MTMFIYSEMPFIDFPSIMQIDQREFIRFIHALVLFYILIVVSVIDIRHMIIPDILSLGLILSALPIAWIHPLLSLQSSLFGILWGGGFLYGVSWIYWFVRKRIGMGLGDVKLLAGIGGWLGFESIIPIVFYASIVGSVLSVFMIIVSKSVHLHSKLPYGPFLALGAWIHLFWGHSIAFWL